MRITKEAIESVKRSADLIEVIESHGVRLKKKGSNYVGLCPFHKEKTPSFTVNPKTNLWHCFGCRAGGDVIGFVCKAEGIQFKEAMEKLNSSGQLSAVSHQHDDNGKKKPASERSVIDRTRLLNRIVSFYHQSFLEDGRAREYLERRGIREKSIFTDFKIGFSNGTLLNTIPHEGDVDEALKEIGILNGKGHELFYGCVVFPLSNENQDCVGLYGRRITDGEVNHLYLPGPRRGLFNWQALDAAHRRRRVEVPQDAAALCQGQAAKRSQSLILTESIIDGLTLYQHGFKEVISCYGVNGLTEDHLNLFARYQTKEVYVCFDTDDVGREGAERIAEHLKEKEIAAHIINLPATSEKMDLNSFFLLTADASSIFAKLLAEANPATQQPALSDQQSAFEKTDYGFVVEYGDRRYEVKGITREGVKLKATIKAAPAVLSKAEGPLKQRFHLDTVDLYSNRSRLFFAKAAAQLFNEKEDVTADDLLKLIGLAEVWRPEEKETPAQAMTKSDEDEALKFLKSPDLFNRLLEDFETLGLTGEESNKLMGYLSAVSRKLDEPLSVMIHSRSAAGKSTLQDAILSLIPPEDFVKYTRLTGQALFYKEENSLVHKLLAIEEEEGARDASYSIRNIQSSKYLSIAATGKDPVTGKLRTEEYKVKGPVALMITTTEVAFDDETTNRFITLTIDESKEMTEKILKRQREQDTLKGLIRQTEADRITARHHNAQRLLRPLKVVNPYASQLTFPSDSLRARRDHKKYLSLIKAIAYLHQYQREVKTHQTISYIEATLDDIGKANHLAHEILGRTLDELSPPSRLLLKLIHKMVLAKSNGRDPSQHRFTRKDVREWTKWTDPQIKRHIRQLEDLEYLYSVAGKKGKEYIYELLYSGDGDDGKAFFVGLADVDRLRQNLNGKNPHLDPTWTAEVRHTPI
jgi:DNA primase catalytic core